MLIPFLCEDEVYSKDTLYIRVEFVFHGKAKPVCIIRMSIRFVDVRKIIVLILSIKEYTLG
jgi:hypothetical protein